MEKDSYIHWLRDKVGTRKVFLPFASVIARNEQNQILLQKRRDFQAWGLPGGILELDEDLNSCARRELWEETGLKVGDLRLVGVYTDPKYDVTYPNGDQVQQFTICFEATINGGSLRLDDSESSDLDFFSVEAINDLDILPWYRDMIEDASRSGPPRFHPPRKMADTEDQIAAVRPHIGHARYSGTGASVLVEKEYGQLLMLKHRGEANWRPPAGFSDLGENVAYTAVRETLEETGLQIQPERIVAIHSTPRLNVTYPNGDLTRNVGVVFKAKFLGGVPRLDGDEIEAWAWMTRRDAIASYENKRRWFFKKLMDHLDRGHFVC